jgi:23S rRNA pseudouridine1911/1915/1917 synthase
MDIDILYEDNDILAINKPAGLVVHGDGRTKEPSVTEWFVGKYPQALDVGESIALANGEKIERHGIVHRIDRETSGVLLLAKTQAGYECLKSQFKNREVEKVYNAFVYGSVSQDQGSISYPISRSTTDFRKWIARTRIQNSEGRGELRDALTYYKVLKRTPEVTLVEAKPKTGRTHQIRVHFKALQRPVVGDPLYAKGQPYLLGFERLALHAREIAFHDESGEPHKVKAPYPADFRMAMDTIGFDVLD